MGATVYTTAGGARFHFDRRCYALANGRESHAARAGWDDAAGLYELRTRSSLAAALLGFAACRVCVPPALALPAVGEKFGHEPVNEYAGTPFRTEHIVCARCVRWELWREAGFYAGRSVPWPCTSAIVLGLAPRGGEA